MSNETEQSVQPTNTGLLTTVQLAKLLGVKPATIEKSRSLGVGNFPPFIRVGDHLIRYSMKDVQEYIEKRKEKVGARAY